MGLLQGKTAAELYEWDHARNSFVCRKLSERVFFVCEVLLSCCCPRAGESSQEVLTTLRGEQAFKGEEDWSGATTPFIL